VIAGVTSLPADDPADPDVDAALRTPRPGEFEPIVARLQGIPANPHKRRYHRVVRAGSLLLIALAALALAISAGAARTKATLRLTSLQPVGVRGNGFAARERVRVQLSGGVTGTRRVTATARGTFTMRFADVNADRCSSVRVVARGSDGTRATLKYLPAPMCLPA
jgi:hypothetical protein